MKRTTLILITIILIIVALNIAYFTLNYTKEGNALIATNFIKNEATYKFDGIPETFKLIGTNRTDKYRWEFVFDYQSGNSGYGLRASSDGVMTNHSARIVMEKGTITSAVLDDKWDMKNQKLIVSPPQRRRR